MPIKSDVKTGGNNAAGLFEREKSFGYIINHLKQNKMDTNEMTPEQLEALAAKKRKEAVEKRQKERAAFESTLEETTSQMVGKALELAKMLEKFYKQTTDDLNAMRDILNEYGMIKGNSKGGFHLKTKDGKYKVVYRFKTLCDWDVRADKAEDLLKDFLKDVVLKRDVDSYELLMALLEKNKFGNLEFSRIQSLYSQVDRFEDPRWKEAIRLFQESFVTTGSKMSLEFYKRADESGKWEPISLNLSNF